MELSDAELDLIIRWMFAAEQEYRTSAGDWSDFDALMQRLLAEEKSRGICVEFTDNPNAEAKITD